MPSFEGRVAVITGGGRGMGRAHARLLAAGGASVVVQDILEPEAQETVRMIRDAGGQGQAIICDVTDTRRLQHELAAMERRLGRLDILVNNAGIGSEATLEEITEEDFDRMFAVHVKGSFFAAQAVVPGMKARRIGKIINISSIWGMVGHHAASDYCAAKAALLGLTKAWARELAPWNIHVNAVAPGGVLTDMVLQQPNIETRMAEKIKLVPLGRYADPSEIAATVAFLASSEADFITGQVISPNGGQTIVGI
jgi:3-oxoacyl-[acyl-carrier protein] reductase